MGLFSQNEASLLDIVMFKLVALSHKLHVLAIFVSKMKNEKSKKYTNKETMLTKLMSSGYGDTNNE